MRYIVHCSHGNKEAVKKCFEEASFFLRTETVVYLEDSPHDAPVYVECVD